MAVVFDDSTTPIAYRADLRAASREVRGSACRNAVAFPLFFFGGTELVGWAEAGYREAMANAQAQAPDALLSDVRADVRLVNVIVFRRQCVEVTAAALAVPAGSRD